MNQETILNVFAVITELNHKLFEIEGASVYYLLTLITDGCDFMVKFGDFIIFDSESGSYHEYEIDNDPIRFKNKLIQEINILCESIGEIKLKP